jgi:hypothetical protein
VTALYLVTYGAIARNVTPSALAAALAAIPRDGSTEALLGLDSLADVTSVNAQFVTRAMSYASLPSAMIPNPQLGEFLRGFYRSTFEQALSTPVTPSAVSTATVPSLPILWLRADAGAASPVSRWADLSGNGLDALQAVGGLRPTQAVNVPTGQKVVRFVGAGPNLLATGAPLAFDHFSYLITFESPALSTPGLLFERSVDATAHSGENLYQSSPTTAIATRSAVTHGANLAAGWGVDGAWHLAAYLYDSVGGGALYLDNVAGAPAATFAPLAAQAVSADLFLGARGAGPALPMTGDMRELFVFPSRLSPSDLALLAGYMKAQVGL